MAQDVVLVEEVAAQELVDHLVLLEAVVSVNELCVVADPVLVVAVPAVVPVVRVPELAPAVPVLVRVVRHVVEAIAALVRFPFFLVLAHILTTAFVARPSSDRGPMKPLSMPTIVACESVVMVATFGCSST